MKIEIVTHCYSGALPQFATFLRYQISSLLLHAPLTQVQLTVCYTSSDVATRQAIAWGLQRSRGLLDLLPIDMLPARLYRRSIGRNLAARATTADLVWFADVDHYFGAGCLDALARCWQGFVEKPLMVWPRWIQISRNHEVGDRQWNEAPQGKLLDVRADEFIPKRYQRAIGGVQIVSGDYCRSIGYLAGHSKYQKPRDDDRPFGDFRDDVVFRKQISLAGRVEPIELPGLYRLRHSQTTYQD